METEVLPSLLKGKLASEHLADVYCVGYPYKRVDRLLSCPKNIHIELAGPTYYFF